MLRFTLLYTLCSTGKTILLTLEMAVGQEVEGDDKKKQTEVTVGKFYQFHAVMK